jgi:hypothetical protein
MKSYLFPVPVAARLLGSRVRIPLGTWMFFFVAVLSCVGRGIFDELITCPKESYHAFDNIKKPKEGGPGPASTVKATDDEMLFITHNIFLPYFST